MAKKDEFPTIPQNLCIKFIGASKAQKNKIRDILISNYTAMINSMVENAGYATTTYYWTDIIPLSGEKISAKDFIKKYEPKVAQALIKSTERSGGRHGN